MKKEEKERAKKSRKKIDINASESTIKLNKLIEEIRTIYESEDFTYDFETIDEIKSDEKEIEDTTTITTTDTTVDTDKGNFLFLNIIIGILSFIFIAMLIAFIAFIIYVCTY